MLQVSLAGTVAPHGRTDGRNAAGNQTNQDQGEGGEPRRQVRWGRTKSAPVPHIRRSERQTCRQEIVQDAINEAPGRTSPGIAGALPLYLLTTSFSFLPPFCPGQLHSVVSNQAWACAEAGERRRGQTITSPRAASGLIACHLKPRPPLSAPA